MQVAKHVLLDKSFIILLIYSLKTISSFNLIPLNKKRPLQLCLAPSKKTLSKTFFYGLDIRIKIYVYIYQQIILNNFSTF